jgi:zinc and cadmium transporter
MRLVLLAAATLFGSAASVGFAGLVLLLGARRLSAVTSTLIPCAIGTLLGTSILGMIPHALEELASGRVLAAVLTGIILFYVLEKFALWRHCHETTCRVHTRAGTLILIGDSVHNFLDGVAIAVAFRIRSRSVSLLRPL